MMTGRFGNCGNLENVEQWRREQTITGLEHPQASLCIPGVGRIVVSSQSGKLRFYHAASYAPVKTPDFGAGANTDNMRYDQLYCRHDRLCEAANPGCPLFAAIGET